MQTPSQLDEYVLCCASSISLVGVLFPDDVISAVTQQIGAQMQALMTLPKLMDEVVCVCVYAVVSTNVLMYVCMYAHRTIA